MSTDSECESHAVLHGWRNGQAYNHVPTRRRIPAEAQVDLEGPDTPRNCAPPGRLSLVTDVYVGD